MEKDFREEKSYKENFLQFRGKTEANQPVLQRNELTSNLSIFPEDNGVDTTAADTQ
ncbi:hypothetical protein [Peribacillus glennii]|uniref:hypothetical protein n=1 Tax=Peribacillus glennii TaxID=2303991 RepID=UPI001314DB21|nr:hypothetical protein [Peribacillus glennii]